MATLPTIMVRRDDGPEGPPLIMSCVGACMFVSSHGSPPPFARGARASTAPVMQWKRRKSGGGPGVNVAGLPHCGKMFRARNDGEETEMSRSAAIMRSTSATISRRWNGLDSTLACLGALAAGCSATAAKPVMNMILSARSISAARLASSMPSIPGITMSVTSRSKRKPLRHSKASLPSPKSVTSWPAFTSACARNLRKLSSSSANNMCAIWPPSAPP